MSEKVLRVQMFGGFAMYYDDEAVALHKVESSKSVRLLQMLLLSLKNGLAKSELIDTLYNWNDQPGIPNRNKNLNNLVYHLRKQLVSCGLPDEEYVEIHDGSCCFKASFPVEVDAEQFEKLVKKTDRISGGGEIVSQLLKANQMYQGSLLPANQSELWFFQKSNYYKELYVRTIHELEDIFIETKDYQNRIALYKRAASIYPFENWQTRLIQCNLEMCRYEEALDIYNNTIELYSRESASPPLKEMRECFETTELMDSAHRGDPRKIHNWKVMDRIFMRKKDDIRKEILEDGDIKGAYYCTYPSFVDYCRIMVRAKERGSFPAVLMFVTLSRRMSKENQKQIDLLEQMGILKTSIGRCLRIGDAYTRYGNRHFIIMLVNIETDVCGTVFKRIEKAYMDSSGKGELWYSADMTQELEKAVH